ncbi:MAG: hypothetical protein ACRDJC_10670 [Thermomicrobiales bacterium]
MDHHETADRPDLLSGKRLQHLEADPWMTVVSTHWRGASSGAGCCGFAVCLDLGDGLECVEEG